MFVSSLSNVVADGLAWRPRFGGHAFVVIAKATFALRQGRASLADEQEPILAADRHYDDDPAQSVYAPSDHVPFKDRVDVTMVGEALARGKSGSRALVTRLCVGELDKRIVCFPPRWIDEHGQLHKGDAFRRVPLRYEHALGGAGSDNPVGIDPDDDSTATRCLPRLEPFGRRRCEDEIACFGPLAATWPSRRRHLRDAAFSERDWYRRPLAESLEPSFFNVAPPDQRLDALADDAVILLENVHPHLPRLRSQLPGLRPRAFVERSGSAREVFLQADSLWIDAGRGLCTVTWRGSFEIASPDQPGHVLVAVEDGGRRLTWPDVAALAAGGDERPSAVRLVAARAPIETLVVDEDLQEQRVWSRAVGDDADDTVVLHRSRVAAPALPFVAPPPAAPALASTISPPVASSPTPSRPLCPVPPPTPPPSRPPAPVALPTPSSPPASPSPWATGSVSAARHSLRPPPTVSQAVAPPPLMLVTAEEAPDDAPPADPSRGSGHLDLIGYDDDPSLTERLRTSWPDALATLDDEPSEARSDELPFDARMRQIFAPPPAEPSIDLERAVAAVLRHATPHRRIDLEHDARAAVDDDGVYRAPLVVLHGRLRLRFDEVATFNALLEACTVALPDSEGLHREVAILRKLQRQGAAVSAEVASELTDRLRRVCRDDEAVDAEAIERRAERQLLGERRYQSRRLLGGAHLRGELTLPGEERAVVTYLPETWRDDLPLFDELEVRLIGELHRRQDQWEDAPIALKSIALGEHVTDDPTAPQREEP